MLLELIAIVPREQAGHFGYRWENAFVQSHHHRHLQIRIARPIDGPHEHLVQRRWNHAHRQSAQAALHDRQPARQFQRASRKGQLKILQPALHLFPYRPVHRRQPLPPQRSVITLRFPMRQPVRHAQVRP